MPNRSKGTRLELYRRKDRPESYWYIIDGAQKIGTGCPEGRRQDAEQALAEYIQKKFKPRPGENNPAGVPVAEVLSHYLRTKAPRLGEPDYQPQKPELLIKYHIQNLIPFWGERMLSDVRYSITAQYVEHRQREGRQATTAGRELKTLRAAVGLWFRDDQTITVARGLVALPRDNPRRERYLERAEAARLIRAARQLGHEHIVRFLLLGLYTGTRHEAALRLTWNRSLDHGYVDLVHGKLHRRGDQEPETSKRRPTVTLPSNMLSHLRRWFAIDMKRGVRSVVPCNGAPIKKLRSNRAWGTIVDKAKLDRPQEIIPHMLRHTCITWLLWDGMSYHDVAGYVGADVDTLIKHYAHHRDYFARPEGKRVRWARG